jgi:hypothetical protein
MRQRTQKMNRRIPSDIQPSGKARNASRNNLAAIAARTLRGKTKKERLETFGFALRNFLDRFYAAPQPEKQEILHGKEPKKLRGALKDGGVADAYLAAVANHLCARYKIAPPAWSHTGHRLPAKPWFALKSPEARIWLLTQSPAAFRERNLFISRDALTRA